MLELADIPKVKKPDTIKELGAVEISALQALVERVSDQVWNLEDEQKENNFACFHHTRHIVFRFIEGMRDHRIYYSNPVWDIWKGMLLPIMDKMVEPYGFQKPAFPKAMLARLEAGHEIDKHRDGAGSNLYTHKIHVPLKTNANAMFYVEDESFHLAEGKGYEVNNIRLHGVDNSGHEDRVHFIFEVFDEAE